MAKILWYGDAVSNTGFGRVTHSVLEHLCKKHEVVVFGINYSGDPHQYPYKIYPAAAQNPSDRFGIGRVQNVVEMERPDFIFCLNDIWIVNQVWERVHLLQRALKFKFIAYFPTDSEWYPATLLRYIKDFDFAITFTIEQAQRLMAHKISPKRLGVVPHGLDQGRFYEMDKNECRDKLGIPHDKFVVFNGNRNQPRKNIDLTIKAFAEFAKGKDDVILYLNMNEKDLGWDIKSLFSTEMTRRDIDPTQRLCMTPMINYLQAPPDEDLNVIYNAVDVGINTSSGEGWGLVPFEHAMCRKAQVVPNHTSNKDIWKNSGLLIDVAAWFIDKDLGVERGMVDPVHAAELLTKLYDDRDYMSEVADKCFECANNPMYKWDKIAEGFDKAMQEIGE